MMDSVSKPDRQLAGIVLCGGQSQRMGRAKADLEFGSETLLQRTVGLLQQAVSHVIVVAAEEQDIQGLHESVTVVRDPISHGGPLVGIREGIRQAQTRGFEFGFVSSCDTPFLSPLLIEFLFAKRHNYDVVVPKDDKYFYPLAAVYRTELVDKMTKLLDEGERRPRTLYDLCATCEVATTELEAVEGGLRSLMNLNTTDDYRQALQLAGLPIPSWLKTHPSADRADENVS